MAGKSKSVRAYDLEGNFLEDFLSLSDAAKELGLHVSNISRVVLGEVVTADCYQFRELTDVTLNHLPPAYDFSNGYDFMPIGKYWKGRLVSVYNSQREAATRNDVSQGNISDAIRLNQKIKGFVFKPLNQI